MRIDPHSGALGSFGPRLKLEYTLLRSFRRRPADRFVVEPGGDVLGVRCPLLLDQFALGQHPPPVLPEEPERLERSMLPQHTAPNHSQVANRDRKPVLPVE